jgi:hypothetical protein
MILYGLLGFTHNGGRTLTVMSPEGAGAAHGIVVLDKPAWDAKKAELGPGVFD